MGFHSLEQVLVADRDIDRTLFVSDHREISWKQFLADVSGMRRELINRTELSWAIYCDELYSFATGFFALLSAGKIVVLPPNGQPGTLNELGAHCDALLSDCAHGDELEGIGHLPVSCGYQYIDGDLAVIASDAQITLFTSGSSGEPKKIEKKLCHLSREVGVLEATFGEKMGEATIYATVSHHHIYGLLFKLLWPMCAGRVIRTRFYSYPELLLKELAQSGAAVLISSPAQLGRMPSIVDVAAVKPHLKLLFSSGGALSEEAAWAWINQFGKSPIEVLGSTETGGIAYRKRNEGEAWRAFEVVQVSSLGSEGLLHVCSPYLADEAGFTLGDCIKPLDEQHFLLLGRVDRIVKIEEKRVSLDEMERRLEENEWVDQARVFKLEAQRRDFLGAVVVLTAAGWSHLEQLGRREMSGVLKNMLLGYFERVVLPRKWRYVEQLPLDSQGKLTMAAVNIMFEVTAQHV